VRDCNGPIDAHYHDDEDDDDEDDDDVHDD
jgi:hypothetical protein